MKTVTLPLETLEHITDLLEGHVGYYDTSRYDGGVDLMLRIYLALEEAGSERKFSRKVNSFHEKTPSQKIYELRTYLNEEKAARGL